MTGLLKKDLYVADKSSRLLLILALVFSLVPSLGSFGTTYAMMLALMIPLNSIAYDEKSRWDRYAAMLPYRAEQLVWGKYLLSYIFTLLAGAIIALSTLIRGVVTSEAVNWAETLQMELMVGVSMLFVTSLGLPALYRFGSEKGRFIMILLLGAGVGVALGVAGILKEKPALPRIPVPAAALILAALAVGVTYVSFRLGVYFYRKRQNGAYD